MLPWRQRVQQALCRVPEAQREEEEEPQLVPHHLHYASYAR